MKIILILSSLLTPCIFFAEDFADILPFVEPVKSEYSMDENISIPYGATGKGTDLPIKYWGESIMYIYRPDGSVRVKQMEETIKDGWDGPTRVIKHTFMFEFTDEKLQEGKYSLVFEIIGKKSQKVSIFIKRLAELKGLETTIEFNKKGNVRPNEKLIAAFTVKNGTAETIKFPSFYTGDINISFTSWRKTRCDSMSFTYPREKLLLPDEKLKNEGRPDFYTWENIDSYNLIVLKPGEHITKEIDFDSTKLQIEEDMESISIWCHFDCFIFIGNIKGKYYKYYPVKWEMKKNVTYEVAGRKDEKKFTKEKEDKLLKALLDKNDRIRSNSAQELGYIKSKKAFLALIVALKDSSAEVRRNAAEALIGQDDKSVIPALIDILKNDTDGQTRCAAIDALSSLGGETMIPVFSEYIMDRDNNVRECLVNYGFCKFKNKSALPFVIQMLKDENTNVRMYATYALSTIGDKFTIPALAGMLKDKDNMVRMQAASALGEMGDSTCVAALKDALKDEDKLVGFDAARSLKKLGDNKSWMPLILESINDKKPEVRTVAADLLGDTGNKSLLPVLLEAFSREKLSSVKRSILEALGKLKDDSVIPLLTEALKDVDIRISAIRACGELKVKSVVPEIVEALKSDDSEIRESAVIALGKIGDKKAIPALKELLNDRVYNIREKAKELILILEQSK